MNAHRRHIRRPFPQRPPLGAHPHPPGVRWQGVARRLGWAVSVLAALALVAIGAQTGRNAACAAVVTGPSGAGETGVGSQMASPVGLPHLARARGADCSLPEASRDGLVATLSPEEYAGSAACGAYLDVTGPHGTVRVQVVGECLTCAPGEVDLSRSAFDRIAGPGVRVVPVGYHTVRNPVVARPVAFRLKRGSSPRWLAIQAVDHGNPLSRLEILHGGRWQKLRRDSGNYWVADRGAGAGPYTVRITDVYGQRLTVRGLRLAPGGLQRTSHHLYAPAKATASPGQGRAIAPRPAAPGSTGSTTGRSDAGADGQNGRSASPAGAGNGRSRIPLGRQGERSHAPGAYGNGRPGGTGSGRSMTGDARSGGPRPGAGAAAPGLSGPAPLAALPSAPPFFC